MPFGERNFNIINSLAPTGEARDAATELYLRWATNAGEKQAKGGVGSMNCDKAREMLETMERINRLR